MALIRIKDQENNTQAVSLDKILELIDEGDSYFWSILWLEAIDNNTVQERSILDLEEQITVSNNGLILTWTDLKIWQIVFIKFWKFAL